MWVGRGMVTIRTIQNNARRQLFGWFKINDSVKNKAPKGLGSDGPVGLGFQQHPRFWECTSSPTRGAPLSSVPRGGALYTLCSSPPPWKADCLSFSMSGKGSGTPGQGVCALFDSEHQLGSSRGLLSEWPTCPGQSHPKGGSSSLYGPCWPDS